MIKTNIGLRRRLQVMIKLRILMSKFRRVVVLKVVSLLVLLMGRSIMGNV